MNKATYTMEEPGTRKKGGKKTKKCRACGKKRSINSDTCPHCGDGTTAVEHIVYVVIVVAIVLGVMALLGG